MRRIPLPFRSIMRRHKGHTVRAVRELLMNKTVRYRVRRG